MRLSHYEGAMKRTLLSLSIVGVLSAVSSAQTSLLPGHSVSVPSILSDVPGTLVDYMTNEFTGKDVDNNVVFTGQLLSRVDRQADNTLAFTYVFDNYSSSIDPIERMSISSFTGYKTSVAMGVDFVGNPWPLASSASRTANGSVVSFNYGAGSTYGPINPGQENRFVTIFTNATDYKRGSAQFIDGGVGTAPAFVPKAVPEPASMAALGLGALGILRRRTRKA